MARAVRARAAWRLGAYALSLLALEGCAIHGLSLRQDDRISVTRPLGRPSIDLPVTVAWKVHDFVVGPDRGSFALFVDRTPPPAGKTIGWLFRNADDCPSKRECSDAAYLAQHDIFRTMRTSFVVDRVTTGGRDRGRFHDVTIVLLDEQGRRLGEGAWSVQFAVRGEQQ